MIEYKNSNGDTLYVQPVGNRFQGYLTVNGGSTRTLELKTGESVDNLIYFNAFKEVVQTGI